MRCLVAKGLPRHVASKVCDAEIQARQLVEVSIGIEKTARMRFAIRVEGEDIRCALIADPGDLSAAQRESLRGHPVTTTASDWSVV